MRKSGEVPLAPPLTVMWYVPVACRPVNVIGYTALYFVFHAPRLVPLTWPDSTVCPVALTTAKDTSLTGDCTMRYACLASPGRYPTWSTRIRPAGAAPAPGGSARAPSASPGTPSRAKGSGQSTGGPPTGRQTILLKARHQAESPGE